MNRKMVVYMLGRIILMEAAVLLLPTVCCLVYQEKAVFSFLWTILIALAAGGFLILLGKTKNRTIYAREGFAIVALAWIAFSVIGALPFIFSGEIPRFIDAFFETVSGFTTTGASILPNVELLSKGMLFWRSFTHWIGGMGVLVLVMAILPSDSGRSIHIMRAEVPGPIVGKLVPKVKTTAKILYLIYFALTILQIILLFAGGMTLYESLVHTFGTAGTGGFGIKADSMASYSPYLQWVVGIFMILFGINFNLFYLLLIRKFRAVLKSEELWVYLGVVAAATGAIVVNLYSTGVKLGTFSDTLRGAFFQVSTIISTTGYVSVDYDVWPAFSKIILLLLMFIGACAGSTAGGLKISRVILLFKEIKAGLRHMLHSRSTECVRFEGKKVDKQTMSGLNGYFALYFLCFAVILLIVSVDPFNMETHISAVAACFNNVGPGFAAVGPVCNYAAYSGLSKLALSAAMLFGRLEIYPMLLLFSSDLWLGKRRTVAKRK